MIHMKIKCVLLIHILTFCIHGNARSPNECRSILTEGFSQEQWLSCLVGDPIKNDGEYKVSTEAGKESNSIVCIFKEPHLCVEGTPPLKIEANGDEEIKNASGYVRGVIVGVDTIESISTRRPDILPVCENDTNTIKEPYAKTQLCADKYQTYSGDINLITRQEELSIPKEVASLPEVSLERHTYFHGENGMEMYFYKKKLFLVYALDGNGKASLPENENLYLLKKILADKYKAKSTWLYKNGLESTKATVFSMSAQIDVEVLEKYIIYPNLRQVRDNQYLISMLPKTEETIRVYYKYERIALENKFPFTNAEGRMIRYVDTAAHNKVIMAAKSAMSSIKNEGIHQNKKKETDRLKKY